jgi:betaine-homocysteine S-methyltransferase
VLDAPEAVRQLHREFVRAGSDIVEAFTYYGHREKLKVIGKEEILEPLNRQALQIAREIADESGALLAGDLCNTNAYDPGDPQSLRFVRQAFEEQVGWAVDADVDLIVGETYSWLGEAVLALEIIKRSGKPAVMTLAMHQEGIMREGMPMHEACRRLEEAGADVVGLNCSRGPATMLPAIERIRQSVSCHVAALPVPYRTTPDQPTFQGLKDPACHCLPEGRPFPTALDPFTCNRYEMAEFAKAAYAMDVRYLGVCCGAGPHHIRALSEALGRRPPASRYSPDMALHSYFGTDPKITAGNREYAARL